MQVTDFFHIDNISTLHYAIRMSHSVVKLCVLSKRKQKLNFSVYIRRDRIWNTIIIKESNIFNLNARIQWSEFLATDPEVRVRFPALPDFLSSSESGTGSTQTREYNWGATWKKSNGSGMENRDYGHRDPLCWQRNTLHRLKLALTSPTSGGRSVGIVRSLT
jgi:hypothetical protein